MPFILISAPHWHEKVQQEAVRERRRLVCIDQLQDCSLMSCGSSRASPIIPSAHKCHIRHFIFNRKYVWLWVIRFHPSHRLFSLLISHSTVSLTVFLLVIRYFVVLILSNLVNGNKNNGVSETASLTLADQSHTLSY